MNTNTKEILVRHAAAHFANKGYEGVSLRDLSRDAGVNSASVHYHFSGKESLFLEVITRYVRVLNELRYETLATVDRSAPIPERIEAVLNSYVLPHLTLCRRPEYKDYARLMARLLIGLEDSHLTESIVKNNFTEIRNVFLGEIQACFPDAPLNELNYAFITAMSLMVVEPINAYIPDSTHSPEDVAAHIVHIGTMSLLDIGKRHSKGTKN